MKEDLTQSPIPADNEPSVTEPANPDVTCQPPALAAEIASLASMTISQLHQKYLSVYGYQTKNRNAATVRKRIAYRLKDRAAGGMSGRLSRMLSQVEQEDPGSFRETKAMATEPITEYTDDPRLPPIGGYLVKEFHGKRYRAKVLADGFELDGKVYKSLSAMAKVISGVRWNPAVFWGLKPRREAKSTEQAKGTEAG